MIIWRGEEEKIMRKSVTIDDEVYGKMTLYSKENIWKVKDKVGITINGKVCNIEVEISEYNSIYVKQKYGLFNEEITEFHKKHPELLKEDYALECERDQKAIYKHLILDNIDCTCKNIEKAALEKIAEILTDNSEDEYANCVGKEKAHKIYAAKTKEEKLESLVLERMRVFREHIEITCTCDWYNYSGGFLLEENGDVMMLSIDNMSI